MDLKPIKETFDELFSHLEALETQSAALLQFLKEKNNVTDKDLAPYLEQAGNTSNVKWRASRLRMERLFESAERDEENAREKEKTAKEANAGRNLVNFMEKSGKKQSGEKPNGEQQAANADSQAGTDKEETTQQQTKRAG